jgi:hypothetical protein
VDSYVVAKEEEELVAGQTYRNLLHHQRMLQILTKVMMRIAPVF